MYIIRNVQGYSREGNLSSRLKDSIKYIKKTVTQEITDERN